MRLSSLVLSFFLVCTGCQQAPAPTPRLVTPPPTEALERKLRLQDRWLAALIEQNELLTAESASPPPRGAASPTPPNSAITVPPPPLVVATPEPKLDVPILEPNAEGVVDARRRDPNPTGSNLETGSRDITLQVQGLVGGPVPSALINGSIYAIGDLVDSLRLEYVGSSSLLLRGTGFAVRLAPSSVPQRIRVSL